MLLSFLSATMSAMGGWVVWVGVGVGCVCGGEGGLVCEHAITTRSSLVQSDSVLPLDQPYMVACIDVAADLSRVSMSPKRFM